MEFGPSGAPEPKRRQLESLRSRLQEQLSRDVFKIRKDMIAKWAAEDDTPFPSGEEIRARAEFELQTLINGLGAWAAVPERELFKARGWMDEFFRRR